MTARTLTTHPCGIDPRSPNPVAGASVPAFVVAMIEPGFSSWDSVGVTVGSNVEADLDALDAVVDGLGRRAGAYWDRCVEFWDNYAAGRTAGHAVSIERRLTAARQSDTKQGRTDLTTELAAVEAAAPLAALVAELLGAKPGWDDLATRYAPLEIDVQRNGDESVVTVRFPARQDFDAVLGGPHSRGEIARRFTFTVNHAKWRDRRVRRLVAIEIDALEIWPDPVSW